MQEPNAPGWSHADPAWRHSELPGLDLSAVWRRHWDWLCGASRQDAPVNNIDAAGLTDTDPHRRLAAINDICLSAAAARAHLPALAGLVHDALEPVAVDAAYAMASAGADAVPPLRDIIHSDTEEDSDLDRGSHDGSRPDAGMPARSAAYGLAEIGMPAVPGLLGILDNGVGSRARKLTAFALGEIAATGTEVVGALCRVTQDPVASVRINAIEALGLKPATPSAVTALSRAIKDADPQARFSAALSLAQIGRAAVPPFRRCGTRCTTRTDTCRAMPLRPWSASHRPARCRVLLPFLKAARWCPHTSPASIY